MKIPRKCYLLLKHLLYARRSQAEDFESRYLATYGHPDAAEYLFIRHLYDLLPRASGPAEQYRYKKLALAGRQGNGKRKGGKRVKNAARQMNLKFDYR